MSATNIPINLLHVRGNVRRDPDLELTELIRLHGVIEPLRVYKNGKGYVVQNGSRRLLSASHAGVTEVPCIIVEQPADNIDDIVTQVIVNTTQKPLSITEKAEAMELLRGQGLNQREIAVKLGVSEPEVSQTLAVLSVHPKLQRAVVEGRISPSALEPLIPLSIEEQGELADAAIKERTVRKIGALVRGHNAKLKASSRVVENNSPDATPAEMQAVSSIEMALVTLRMASGTRIENSEMRVRGYEMLVSLMQVARSIEESLAG